MGAAKLPEQIVERRDAGLAEAGPADPFLHSLKSQPLDRIVRPEEENRRTSVTAGALKGARTISMRIATKAHLQRIQAQIDRLRSTSPVFDSSGEWVRQINSLKRLAAQLRAKLGSKRVRRSTKRK